MRAFTDSFIVSNLGQNYTVSEFHHRIMYSVKNTHFFTEKSLSQPQKRILVSWYHKLMGKFFRLLGRNVNAYVEKTASASKLSKPTVSRWKKILMLQNALLKISSTRSSHSLSTTYLRLRHSGIYGWTFQALWMSAVIRNTATNRNRLIVYIWWSCKLINTCLCQSEGIYLTRTLMEFNTSVIAVTKMITYKFLCGVLLRMHGKSADGVFYLAILALLKTRQTLIVFH